jgi:hypothetical protein
LGDQRNDGESNCNSGDETGQMAQPLMFMMMMMTKASDRRKEECVYTYIITVQNKQHSCDVNRLCINQDLKIFFFIFYRWDKNDKRK